MQGEDDISEEKSRAIEIFNKFKHIRLSEGEAMLTDKSTKKCCKFFIECMINEGATQYGIHAVVHGREKFWYKVKEELEKL